jgi:tRNA/rRNA methyltransferase
LVKDSSDDLHSNSGGSQGDLALDVRIVLVEPAGALNLGAVARVIKNMGLSQLWLVNPQSDRHSEEAQQMAVHAKDILNSAQVVNSLPAALVGCQRAIATVGRLDFTDEMITAAQDVVGGLAWLIAAPTSAIVFGPEDRGLSNREIAYCQEILTIPTSMAYPSLNLAQAVGVCCYQLRQLAIAAGEIGEIRNIDRQTHPTNKNKVDQNSAPINNPNLRLVAPPLNPPINSDQASHKPDLPDRENANANKFVASTSQNDKDLLDSASIDTIEAYYQHLETVLLQIGFLYPHTAFSRMKKLRRIFNKATLTESEVTMLRGMLSQIAWAAAHGDRHT